MSKRSKRGRPIKVPEQWLADVRAYWERSGKTLEVIGVELAGLMGRAKPVGPTSVHDYIRGKATTDEMTRAFAQILGVEPPILGVDDAEVVQWCDVGRRLKAQTGDVFHDELARLVELVETLERLRRKP